MNKDLETILNRCKCGVYVEFNPHRDVYESVEQYFYGVDPELEIDDKEFEKMLDSNTIVRIQFYPDAPIGGYTVHCGSLEAALKECVKIIDGEAKKNE